MNVTVSHESCKIYKQKYSFIITLHYIVQRQIQAYKANTITLLTIDTLG